MMKRCDTDILSIRTKYRAIKATKPERAILPLDGGIVIEFRCDRRVQAFGRPSTKARAA